MEQTSDCEKCVAVPIEIEKTTDQMERSRGFLATSCRSGRRGICVSVAVLAAVIACVLLAFTAFASSAHTSEHLQQVAIVFRHGDKNPTETYPKDPYVDYAWPDGWGALTKKGMLQLYTLGQRLRAKYKFFIGDKYVTSDLLVRSSYADRCIMSAQALLAALYPPAAEDLFVPGLPWRPVPVHSIPRSIDKLIVSKSPCPRLEKEMSQAYLNFSINSNGSLNSLYKELSANTGKEIANILDLESVYNILEIEEFNGLSLPTWAKSFYNDDSKALAAKCLALFTSNVIQRRLRGGPLLKEILQNMVMRRNGTDKHKLYLYSAHDLTLVNIMRAMGFTEELLRPEYGAALIFELYATDGEQDNRVEVLYFNNTETTIPRILDIPGCTQPCSLDTLFRIWDSVLPDNWERECLV